MTYNLDLTQVFTGELSLRRVGVLINNLPVGSLLRKRLGGAGAWTDEVSAVFAQGNRLEGILITAFGGKKKDVPKPASPPEPGWFEKAEVSRVRREERARRWVEAHS
jgi:hypothetical protein